MTPRVRAAALLLFAGIGTLSITESSAEAAVAYIRSTNPPWGSNTNEQAMDMNFFPGGWDNLQYGTVNPAVLFSDTYTFIYMEGSDSNAIAMANFINANGALMEAWVFSGGGLFVNAGPNQGGIINVGFGGITINYPDMSENPGSPANAAHPIWLGPFLPTPLSFTGGSFAHATVSGPGLIPLMVDANGGQPHLAELPWGTGRLLVGGLTTSNFWQPQPEVLNLRANMIAYLEGGDADEDGVSNFADNCAFVSNPTQDDFDTDGDGDACDPCPFDIDNDVDADLVCGEADNCPDLPNEDQANADGDQFGDLCDFCPLDIANDADFDGVCESFDNCPVDRNPDQADADENGIGDACDKVGGDESTSTDTGDTGDDSSSSGSGSTGGESDGSESETGSSESSSSSSDGSSGTTEAADGSGESTRGESGSGSAAVDEDDSGCSCSTPTSTRSTSSVFALLGLGGLVLRRRRRAA